jgi:hypothetical protein
MAKTHLILAFTCTSLWLAGCAGSSNSTGGTGGSTTSSQSASDTQGTGGSSQSSSPKGGSSSSSQASSSAGGSTSSGQAGVSTSSQSKGGSSGSSSSSLAGQSSGGHSTATSASAGSANGGTSASGSSGGSSSGSSGGKAGSGGTSASSATGGSHTGGSTGSSGSCGTINSNPFGCKFAWGLADFGGSLAAYNYLQFMTTWVETGLKADGTFTTCSGCKWLKDSVAPTNLIPVYYAYMIGFLGHANGLVDGNQCPASNPNCPNLTTGGAALIKSKRAQIVNAYAEYAKQSYAAWPTKPLVWLLEGDYIQFNDPGQSSPLTMAELVQLAADVTCAIKSNMPNAVVGINHTVWNSDQETKEFWNGMKAVNYDIAWTTGVANNNGFIPSGTNASTYNGATAKYSVVHQLSGKPILVDDGCGAETNEDWSKGSVSLLNGLISSGVIAFNHCGHQSSNYQSLITALEPQLSSTCQ